MTKTRGNGKLSEAVLLVKIPRAQIQKRSKMVGINLGCTSKLCSTKARGNGARFETVLLVKIPSVQIQKCSKIVEIHIETVKIKSDKYARKRVTFSD